MRCVFLDAGLTLLKARPSLGGVYAAVTAGHGVEVDPRAFETAAEAAFHAMGREHREGGDPGLRTSDAIERASWHRHARRVMDAVPAMGGLPFEPWFEDLYRDFGSAAAWEPYPDVAPALEALHGAGARLAVVSNWDSRLRRILDEHGLVRWFETVVISAEVGWRKPHPGIFRRALEEMGATPAEVLHCGDSVGDDVEGARAAGIRPVLLARAGGKTAGGAPVIGDLRELVALVAGEPGK
jgi:putative hydrolase of the HAD superfamily